MRIGRPSAGDDEVWGALRSVGLADVVRALPHGLDTPLGEDGAGLSAGQRARVALARVVLAGRPVVLLDEPSAHLDEETEQVLLETLALLAQRSLVVVVAHRPAVLAAADRVVELVPATAPVAADDTRPAVAEVVRPQRPAAPCGRPEPTTTSAGRGGACGRPPCSAPCPPRPALRSRRPRAGSSPAPASSRRCST